MIKAVIFDMDGVVVDTEHLHVAAERELFARFHVKPTQVDWHHFVGRSARDVMRYMRRKYDLRPPVEDLVRAKHLIYKALVEQELELVPGFMELVETLGHDVEFALTTSAKKDNARRVIDRFGLDKLFKVVITADDVERTKPDPEPYAKTISLLKLKPEECVVIEDAVNGLDAARGAGAHAIGLVGTFDREKLNPHADEVVDSLLEIPALLKEYL